MFPCKKVALIAVRVCAAEARLARPHTAHGDYTISVETREVVHGRFCKLIQFRTSNLLCRRCHRPMEVEAPRRLGPCQFDHHPEESSASAGLKVAGQVKEIRRARHLSQRQVAGRMQVPRTYISKIENGKAIPTLSSLERLAAALGVECAPTGRRWPAAAATRRWRRSWPTIAGRDCGLAAGAWSRCTGRCCWARCSTWPHGRRRTA